MPPKKRARKENVAAAKSAPKPSTSRSKWDVPDWQQHMDKVMQRDEHLLDQEMWTDCVFIVGDDKTVFKCHRLYLAKTSPVFAAMLFGKLYKKGEAIRVTDVSRQAFSALLGYIYKGEVKIASFEAACDLLYACKKYLMPLVMQEKVRAYLWTSLYPDNVWSALEFAEQNDEPELLATAWQVIELKTEEMLKVYDFVYISLPKLLQLVQKEALRCSEVGLINACVRWASKDIENRGLVPDPPSLRETLAPVLPYLRVLTVDAMDFFRVIDKSQLIKPDEVYSILKCIALPESTKVPENFCPVTTARKKSNIVKVFVFGDAVNTTCPCQNELEWYEKYERVNTAEVFFHFEENLGRPWKISKILVPTQMKFLDEDEDNAYQEDLSVYCLNDGRKKLLEIQRFIGTAKYNHHVEIQVNQLHPSNSRNNDDIFITVVHHKSGTYPLNGIEINKNFYDGPSSEDDTDSDSESEGY